MGENFIKMLKEIFPGHGDHFSATNIGTLYLLFIKKCTATDPDDVIKYSNIFDKEVENIKSAFGIDAYPEVFEEDKIAQKVMDAKKAEEDKAKVKAKQFVA